MRYSSIRRFRINSFLPRDRTESRVGAEVPVAQGRLRGNGGAGNCASRG